MGVLAVAVEIVMVRDDRGHFMPADEEGAAIVATWPLDRGYRFEIARVRNIGFHRKGMKLLRFAFDHWEPAIDPATGMPAEKNFDQFRKDLTVLAGYFDRVFSLDGSFKLVAHSLAFDKMDEDRFKEVYRALLAVIWKQIFEGKRGYYSEKQIDSIVSQLLGYE